MVINTNGIFSASSAGDAVCYTGNGSTNITATTYRSLYVGTDSSGGVTETGARTYTLAGNITAIQLIVGPTSGSYNQTLNDGGNTITFTGNNFVLNKGIFSPTGTVDYTQDSGDVTIKVLNYYNLQIGVGVSPTGTHKYTLNNNATVNGTFTIGSTTSSPVQTFSPGSYILSIGNSLTSGAPLVINSYSGTATGAIDTTTGTIKYNGVGSFSMPATSFYNLTLQQTSTYTPAGAINIYGNLTVTDATLNPSGNLITGVGASNTLSATGKIIVDQTTFVGNYSGFETITLGTGSTVSYSANTATTINNFSYYNLNVGVDASLSAPCTYTMAGDTSVSHVLTIGQTSNANIATLSPGVYALKITGTGTPVVLNSYSSTKTGAFYSTAGTVNYAGAGSTNIASATYYNLQAGNDATISSQTYTLAGDITVMNVLTIGPASGGNQQTLKEWGHVITLSGTGTPLVINTNGFLNVQTAGDTVYYQGNGSTNITATTYRNLYIGTNNSRTETQSGSRIYTLLGDISAGQIQVGPTSGSWTQTLNDGGYTITMTSAGAVIFSVNNNGALLATGTVNYLGGADSWIGHATYYNLQVGNAVSQATTNYNLNGNTAVAGVLTVGSSGGSNQQTLNDQGFTITLSGTGTPLVVNNNGAVSFTGTFSYTGSAVNIMQVSYYNLTLNAPQTATFSHSATTMISGSFTAVGSVGNIITINSDLSGSPATLSKASGIVSCDYISLKDNTATGGAAWHAGAHSTQVSDVTGWLDFNTAPVFSPGPSDGNSSTDTPTNAGSSVNFSAVATDNEYDNYYLAVCKTGAVTPHSNSAPTCDGGSWCISVNIATGYSASCSYLTSAGSAESNAWYAFVCDKNISSLCSPVSQGAEDNSGSPFIVNHAPAFSAVSVSVNPVASGAQQTFSATASDTDTGGAVVFYACKSNDFTGSACGSAGEWCHSQTSVSNPSCNYTVQAGDGKGAKNYFGYIVDNHSFSPTNNPIFGTFAISGNSSSSIVKLSGHIKINGGAIVK
jgi:hypothetical protein